MTHDKLAARRPRCEARPRSRAFLRLQPKTQYWAQHLISAFLIYVDGKLAGFVVVDNEVLAPASQYNMGYFFVARRYRRQGVGRVVFAKLLSMSAGRWGIYHLAQNQSAGRFWRALLGAGGHGDLAAVSDLRQKEWLIHDEPCNWFGFDTTSASASIHGIIIFNKCLKMPKNRASLGIIFVLNFAHPRLTLRHFSLVRLL